MKRVRVQPVAPSDISAESKICHYDQLSEQTRQELIAVDSSRTETLAVDPSDDEMCDYVKFTDYFQLD